MIEIPLWQFEAAVVTIACVVMVPLGYWVGYRDRSRRAFMDGYHTGRKTKVVSPFDD